VKYAYIESQRGQHAILKMCRWLNVSRSGYYKWRNRMPCQQSLQREQVRQAVILTFEQFKKRYGAPRIKIELNEAGISCSLNHVAKLMAESGLRPVMVRIISTTPQLMRSTMLVTTCSVVISVPMRLMRSRYLTLPTSSWIGVLYT
jgi:hypothetical protein